MKRLLRIGLLLILGSCSSFSSRTGEKPLVFVSIPPQVWFMEQLAGEEFQVEVMVGPGENPATYEPRPRQLEKLSRAKAFFAIGVPFEEAWMPRIKELLPRMKVFDVSAGIPKQPVDDFRTLMGGSPEKEESHGHGHLDPHIWLSPELGKQMAENMAVALAHIDPEGESRYKERLALLLEDLTQLQKEVRVILGQGEKAPFAVFHPSWGYFCREFGLEQIPIEVRGKEPAPRELQAILDYLKERGVKTVMIQKEFSRHAAVRIAEALNGEVVTLDPLGSDYPALLKEAARAAAGKAGE